MRTERRLGHAMWEGPGLTRRPPQLPVTPAARRGWERPGRGLSPSASRKASALGHLDSSPCNSFQNFGLQNCERINLCCWSRQGVALCYSSDGKLIQELTEGAAWCFCPGSQSLSAARRNVRDWVQSDEAFPSYLVSLWLLCLGYFTAHRDALWDEREFSETHEMKFLREINMALS